MPLNWPTQQQSQPPPIYQQASENYQIQQQGYYKYKQQTPEQKKTCPLLTVFLGLLGVVLLVIGGSFAFNIFPDKTPSASYPTNSLSPGYTIPPSSPTNPSHSFPRANVVTHSEYWNAGWDALALYQTLISVNRSYHKEHTYIKGKFDCNDMAIDIWDILVKQGITSVLAIGNLDIEKESFADCDHAWLLIIHRDKDAGYRIFIIEPTNGETYAFDPKTKAFLQYMEGYFYSSPSDLRADIRERW